LVRSVFSCVFPFFLYVFFVLSPLFLRAGVEGVFIRQKGAGAFLLPPYDSAWGAGLATLPQRRVGRAVGVVGKARLPWCIII